MCGNKKRDAISGSRHARLGLCVDVYGAFLWLANASLCWRWSDGGLLLGYIWCLEGSGREAAAGRQCKGSYAQPALSRLYGQMVQTICPSIRQQKTSMSHDIEVLC